VSESKFTPPSIGCSWKAISGSPTSAIARWYSTGIAGSSGADR
jgi:hypothetical protein